ncbi:MAG: restriction endonuclease subunit S [Turneriella sp.]
MAEVARIGDFLRQVRRTVVLKPKEKYKLLGVQWYGKGMFLREEKLGSEIKADKLYRVHTGDFVYNRLFAWKYSFAIVEPELDGCLVSNEFPTFEYDLDKIDPYFLLNYVLQPDFIDMVNRVSGGMSSISRKRYKEEEFVNSTFPNLTLSHQREIGAHIRKSKSKLSTLGESFDAQSTYLTQLRQAILQEAIEGKLTEDWRKKNLPSSPKASARKNPSGLPQASHLPLAGEEKDGSEGSPPAKGEYGEAGRGFLSPRDGKDLPAEYYDAAVLLEKIKAENAALISKGKLKKEKPLPPIASPEPSRGEPGEVPFALPEGWVWTRLGEICSKITDGFHHTPKKLKQGSIYISATHVRETGINWRDCLYISKAEHDELYKKAYPKKGEILITNRGAGCGTPAIIDIDEEFSFQNTALIGFNQSLLLNKYIQRFVLVMRERIMAVFVNGGLQPMLSNVVLRTIPFPLPPLAEQHAIVERVDKLLAMVDQLEQQVAERKVQAEELMQAVLREAFG